MSFTDILLSMGNKTDKQQRHEYGPWYDLLLKPHKDTALNVLEVGVCQFGGGCVMSLIEYFSQATIWAADIDDARCFPEVLNHPRVKFLKGNAYLPTFPENFSGVKFDVIIDDASHEVDDQILLAKMMMPLLNEDGVYIIEDCCTGHWLPKLKDLWSLGFQHTLIDNTTAEIYDNTLVILRHKK